MSQICETRISGKYAEGATVAAWKKYVALAILVAGICLATYCLHVPAPSHYIHTDPVETAEWLAWLGVLGVLLAIVQLIQTESATTAALNATKTAVSRLVAFDAATQLSAASHSANQIIVELQQMKYYEAWVACKAFADELLRIESNFRHLQKSDISTIQALCELSVRARDTLLPWASRPPTNIGAVYTLASGLEKTRDKLNQTIQALRIERGEHES